MSTCNNFSDFELNYIKYLSPHAHAVLLDLIKHEMTNQSVSEIAAQSKPNLALDTVENLNPALVEDVSKSNHSSTKNLFKSFAARLVESSNTFINKITKKE
jgi:hypothetical protein